jgi:gamma-glutamylcyclotransferase (GGCT)/AIG2-like uncharacterized protein YtfP
MIYFAYGSNMDNEKMTERKINFSSRQLAKLSGYKLVFNKKTALGYSSYANIVLAENNFVEGILYEFPDSDILKLDECEGYPNHYFRTQVTVTDKDGNSIKATTYIAQEDKIEEGLLPTREYLNHLLAGKDLLSTSYFEALKQVRTYESK